MDTVIRIEILHLLLNDPLKDRSTIKIRPKDLLRKLRCNNPIFFDHVNNDDIKKELAKIYPIHNNMKKNTKWFKITRKRTMEYIVKHRINILGL